MESIEDGQFFATQPVCFRYYFISNELFVVVFCFVLCKGMIILIIKTCVDNVSN